LAALAFGGALFVSWLLTPVSARLGEALGLIDRPDGSRKLHKDDTPRSGGIAIALAFFGTVLGGFALASPLAALIGGQIGAGVEALIANMGAVALPAAGVLGGGLAMFFLGLADDRFDLPAKLKLFAQIAAAGALCASGVRAQAFLPEPMGWVLSVVWVVALCNAFNFLDNMDGLASGVAGLASLAFAVYSFLSGEWLLMAVWAALAGSVGGFWLRNFFVGRPFLGDGGTLMIGFLVGALALRGT
jgi:UDP-GlcNAc:undecaprenyl-phosphate GlcNAc-1-phosphate transferase